MPKCKFVFENISPIIYRGFYRHYRRVGYNLDCKDGNGSSLMIVIKDASSLAKLVSPDLLLFHSKIRLELLCSLYCDGKLRDEKTFYFSSLISRPRNPIMNNCFFEFNMEKLVESAAPQVEQYFRRLMLKSKNEAN
jgi:hypothetical protein